MHSLHKGRLRCYFWGDPALFYLHPCWWSNSASVQMSDFILCENFFWTSTWDWSQDKDREKKGRNRTACIVCVWAAVNVQPGRGTAQRLPADRESEVGLQPREHREDEVPKRGVLSDEEARRVAVSVLKGGLLLGGDVLLLRAVPHLLQAGSGRQRDVGPGAVHGLALHQPPLLLVQLRQDGHPRLVLKAWSWRVSCHIKLAELAVNTKAFTSPWGKKPRMFIVLCAYSARVVVVSVRHGEKAEGNSFKSRGASASHSTLEANRRTLPVRMFVLQNKSAWLLTSFTLHLLFHFLYLVRKRNWSIINRNIW